MGIRTRALSLWTEKDGDLLRLARRQPNHQHNQKECAAALAILGAKSVSQGTVSAWETGKTNCPSEDNLDAVRLYLLEAGFELTAGTEPPASPDDASSDDPAESSSSRTERPEVADLGEQATQPEPMDAAFDEAILAGLRSGCAQNEIWAQTAERFARRHGIDW